MIKRIPVGKINYEIEIEIYKGKGCDHHRIGEIYRYPEDIGVETRRKLRAPKEVGWS
jgi:hypothetical protein